MHIPFNKPYATGKELSYINETIERGHISGDGLFTKKCQAWLEQHIGSLKVLLTHSCTAALEMAAILADIQPGEEIIMPSYTFVSTANAFVLRGGVPVFVDIKPDTLNIDESKIEAAITSRTRAIVPVHYAGVGCEMDTIMAIAEKHGLLVIEDAAQGIKSTYRQRPLGSIGHLATLSFHETKNVNSGEGGALLINDSRFIERAEIIREKGTDRSKYFRGEVDRYTWIDIGSSFLPSEIEAAYLCAQLEQSDTIIMDRMKIWRRYQEAFTGMEEEGKIRCPVIPEDCQHNAHLYYLLLPDLQKRTSLINYLKECGIGAVFHYVPLHSSRAGLRYGRTYGDMVLTQELSERLVRLPLWPGMEQDDVDLIINKVIEGIGSV